MLCMQPKDCEFFGAMTVWASPSPTAIFEHVCAAVKLT